MRLDSPDELTAILHLVPGFSAARIARQLASGATGNTYLVERSNEQFVLRLRSEDAAIFVPDMQLEERCSALAHEHGLAPQTVFCDVSKGVLLRHYIEGVVWSQEQMQLETKLMALAAELSRLHRIPVATEGSKWPETAVKRYEGFLQEAMPDVLSSNLRSMLAEIASMPVAHALCHNDLVCANIMELPHGKIMFLDWEYAGISDPYFDLANVIRHHNLSADLEVSFLDCYAKAGGIRLAADRLQLWKMFYDGLQALWLLVLRQKGQLDLRQLETLERLLALDR